MTGNTQDDATPPQITTIKLFKLVTGETIISSVMSLPKRTKMVLLDLPMLVLQMPLQDKRTKRIFTTTMCKPWIEFSEEDQFQISKSSILVTSTPEQELVHHYLKSKVEFDEYRMAKEISAAEDELDAAKKDFEQKTKKVDEPKKPSTDDEDDIDNQPWSHRPRFNI